MSANTHDIVTPVTATVQSKHFTPHRVVLPYTLFQFISRKTLIYSFVSFICLFVGVFETIGFFVTFTGATAGAAVFSHRGFSKTNSPYLCLFYVCVQDMELLFMFQTMRLR